MFVCRTRTRSRAGKQYFTFRLIRSQRVGDKVRQRAHWRSLTQRIQQILDPQQAIYDALGVSRSPGGVRKTIV